MCVSTIINASFDMPSYQKIQLEGRKNFIWEGCSINQVLTEEIILVPISNILMLSRSQ